MSARAKISTALQASQFTADQAESLSQELYDAVAHELAEQIRHHYGVGSAPIRAHCNPDCEYCLAAARTADLIDPEVSNDDG